MGRRCLFVLLAAGLGLALVAPSGAEEKPAVARLVEQLGSPEYDAREEATQALDALGPAALDALRAAARGSDPEVRRRAAGLVRRIEHRQETARLLAPQRVRLVWQDTPLADAAADFARKTGAELKLDPLRVKAADRTVTLDTGEISFWEAFDRFCATAGVAEAAPAPPPPNPNARTYVTSSVIIINNNARAIPSDAMRPETPDKDEPLLLADGTPRPLPTHYAGALKLTALPPDTQLGGQQKADGEVLLVLDVAIEPRLRWQRALGLRIDRALDDQGQNLAARPGNFLKPVARGNPTMYVNGVPVYDEAPAEGPARQVPLLLRPGETPAKLLKELSGTLVALVQAAPETLVAVDNVLEATGKTAAGGGGSWLKVLEVDQAEAGEVKLRLLVETPPRGLDDKSALPSGMMMMVNGRTLASNNDEPLSALNFALLDAKGKALPTLRAVNTGKRVGTARELELTYQVDEGGPAPARLVYTSRRGAVLDVPFTLKDVPLP